jgi:hypothetical protein
VSGAGHRAGAAGVALAGGLVIGLDPVVAHLVGGVKSCGGDGEDDAPGAHGLSLRKRFDSTITPHDRERECVK